MNENAAVHALGNGSFLLYGQGPNLIGMHPGDYSTPSIAGLICQDAAQYSSSRNPGSNAWSHTVYQGENEMTFWDALDPEYNVFRRIVRSHYYTVLRLELHPAARLYFWKDYPFGDGTRDCASVILPKGTMYFTSNVTCREYRLYILAGGCVSLDEEQGVIRVSPGEGMLTFIAAQPQEAEAHLAAGAGGIDVFARSDAFWKAFLARVSARVPEHPRLDAAVESVALLIKGQQSRDGGIMAGHFYPMAYVRDMAGAARGLIRMGLIPEARAVVQFWARKFSRFGSLLNAESMGHDDARLLFSNDEVEVPAYVMLTAFACFQDQRDLEALRPMLSWAARVQAGHCVLGMTGFSGDETYIAGGQFPRYLLYQGSAESTMLFILSLQKYLSAFGPDPKLEEALSQAQAMYRANFVRNGRLMANNPARETACRPPRFHMGYCDVCLLTGRNAPLTWLERTEDGLYRCPDCMGRPVPSPAREARELGSVGLLPAWHRFDLIPDAELAVTAQPYLSQLRDTGDITSSPGGDSALGYDYALLLSALVRLGRPEARDALELMLNRLDEAGAWSEYYRDGRPYNCRCRPWESGVNIAAALDAWDKLR